MDLDLPVEYEDFRAMVRDFAESRIGPIAEELDREHRFPYEIVEEMAQLGLKYRLPAISFRRDFVDAGGLLSCGANVADNYRIVTEDVDKILKGAKPADLPVEQPTKFELVINLKAARAIGLTVPPSLMARADELIEAGLRELDQEKRAEIYQEFEQIMADQLPYLWAWSDRASQGLRATVNGAEAWTPELMTSPTWAWEVEKINNATTAQ